MGRSLRSWRTLVAEDPSAAATPTVTQSERPPTFRDVFSIREYRAVYFSSLVSFLGDFLTQAAVAVLVYQQSNSALLSAAAFAMGFLPWAVGGTVLSALAERYPYRRVLIVSDIARMVLTALLLVPHAPMWFLFAVLFAANLGGPTTQSARSALLPLLVKREQLPIAIATSISTTQAVQVVGYLAGAALAVAINPQTALVVDVLTFAVSAVLIAAGVRPRPAAQERTQRTHLLRESGEGFRLVFGRETLRSIAVLVFVLTMFSIVPESLAAAWAAQGDSNAATRGLDQGLIMAAGPIGFVIGGVLIGRLVDDEMRNRLVRPLAVLSTVILIPALFGPPPQVAAVLVGISGLAQGGLVPTLNSRFVLILPHGYRARAFGVMQTGIRLSQFAGIVVTGWLADLFWLPLVVGIWSIGGTVFMVLLAARWPNERTFQTAIDQATAGAAAPVVEPEDAPVAQPDPMAGDPVTTTSATPHRA